MREADPEDRRRSLVSLTPGVSERIGQAWDTPGTAYGEVLRSYTDAELELIADYLRRATRVGLDQAERLTSGE